MKKNYLIVLVVVFIAVIAFFALNKNSSNEQIAQETSVVENESAVGDNTVVYTDSGFSPNNINVNAGTTVTFINQSRNPMWVASDPHPVHTDFSAFDQLRDGEEYSFTFTEAGAYPYHNHLVPTDIGTIVVE